MSLKIESITLERFRAFRELTIRGLGAREPDYREEQHWEIICPRRASYSRKQCRA